MRRKRPETTRPNHILLFTIINPFYPITVVSKKNNECTSKKIYFIIYLLVFSGIYNLLGIYCLFVLYEWEIDQLGGSFTEYMVDFFVE